jgi:uncharacterized membrane protein YdjX (TVP38/TMEM64 family)
MAIILARQELRAFFVLLGVLLLIFLCLGFMESTLEQTLHNWQHAPGMFALMSSLILISDIILPVPSSVVLYLNGHVLGITYGSLCSWLALMIAATAGYYIGRLFRRKNKEPQITAGNMGIRADMLMLMLSRGIPLLSESICILWGWQRKSLLRFLAGNALGNAPVAVLYAWAGDTGKSENQFLPVFAITLLVSGLLFVLGKLVLKTEKA